MSRSYTFLHLKYLNLRLAVICSTCRHVACDQTCRHQGEDLEKNARFDVQWIGEPSSCWGYRKWSASWSSCEPNFGSFGQGSETSICIGCIRMFQMILENVVRSIYIYTHISRGFSLLLIDILKLPMPAGLPFFSYLSSLLLRAPLCSVLGAAGFSSSSASSRPFLCPCD